jgi:hypothetical protein
MCKMHSGIHGIRVRPVQTDDMIIIVCSFVSYYYYYYYYYYYLKLIFI